MSSPPPKHPLAPVRNAQQMDDLLHLLGFQDLQDAQDWVIKHGQGRVIPISQPHQNVIHPAHVHDSQMADAQPDPHYLCQELDRTKQQNLQLKSTLVVAQARIATLEEERLSQLAHQARHSNPLIQQAISCNPNMSNIGVVDHPCSSSSSPVYALQLSNQHLKSQNDALVKTLADEKEKMEQERKRWRMFKRRYAARLAPQSTSKRKTILTPQASPHHNVNAPGLSLTLPSPSQKRQNDENVASSSTPLHVNIKNRNLLRGPLSPQKSLIDDHLSNRSIQPLTPVFPNLSTSIHVSCELQTGTSLTASSDADPIKAQVDMSSQNSNPRLLAELSDVEVPARNITVSSSTSVDAGVQPKQTMTCEKRDTDQQAPCPGDLTTTRCDVENSGKADPPSESAAENGFPYPQSAAVEVTPAINADGLLADKPRTNESEERHDGQPEAPHMLQSCTVDVRPAPDPTRVSCARMDIISPHPNCDRRPTSPPRQLNIQSPTKNPTIPRRPTSTPRQHGSSVSPRKTSPRSRLPLSHRVKPDHNTKKSQRKHTTPQTVPRSKGTLTGAGPNRSALPTSKWIRYSDRKSRMAASIWKDDDDEEEDGKSRSKGKGKGKLERGPGLVDVAFKADDERHVGVDEVERQAEGPQTKPVQIDRAMDMICSQEIFLGELSTTEDESPPNDVFGPLHRVSSPRNIKAADKPERDVSQTKKDASKKTWGAGSQRAQQPDSHSEPHSDSSSSESFPGQKYMRMVHKKRKAAVEESLKKRKREAAGSAVGAGDIEAGLEVDPDRNFGCGHVFDEVARGKDVRKQMRGQDCDCCAGYYEQAAKDFKKMPSKAGRTNQIAEQHQNEISRHRHFKSPPRTPPYYWQMGFPDDRQVKEINRQAEENQRLRLAKREAQAKKGIGPYRFKTNSERS